MDLASRDPREMLTKSFLVGADLCNRRAWLDLYDPRPFVMTERVAFGKAVDLGIQKIIAAIGAGIELPTIGASIMAEIMAMLDETDDTDPAVDLNEVIVAIDRFATDIAPRYDLAYASVQRSINIELEGIGRVSAHPDVILADGSIYDVKTAGRAKLADAASTSYTELAWYALIREAETGVEVPRVGYWTWCRTANPYWQIVESDVTPRMLAVARSRAEGYRSAIDADVRMNAGAEKPRVYAFPGGPAFAGLCRDCAHNPARQGSCTISEETR